MGPTSAPTTKSKRVCCPSGSPRPFPEPSPLFPTPTPFSKPHPLKDMDTYKPVSSHLSAFSTAPRPRASGYKADLISL